jgi:uncharacterized membrane protein YoaT (DUF817 family)
MVYHFWYILIHVGLGLVGYQIFLFTNTGGIYAALASGVVQAYAVYEIHKLAWPRFQQAHAQAASVMEAEQMKKDYRSRLVRQWVFRTCIYALLTLIAAMAARAGYGGK